MMQMLVHPILHNVIVLPLQHWMDSLGVLLNSQLLLVPQVMALCWLLPSFAWCPRNCTYRPHWGSAFSVHHSVAATSACPLELFLGRQSSMLQLLSTPKPSEACRATYQYLPFL